MDINVTQLMETENNHRPKKEGFVKPRKPDTWTAIQRLEGINGMIRDLSDRVNNAYVGNVGQSWVDAYENLHEALQVCKSEEINIITECE